MQEIVKNNKGRFHVFIFYDEKYLCNEDLKFSTNDINKCLIYYRENAFNDDSWKILMYDYRENKCFSEEGDLKTEEQRTEVYSFQTSCNSGSAFYFPTKTERNDWRMKNKK